MRRLLLVLAAVAGFALAVVPALADNQSVGTTSTRFSPDKVAVRPGEKVTISNTANGFHDIHWDDAAPAGSEEPSPNPAPWTHDRTFDTAGTYTFYCSQHRDSTGMTGTVYVNDAGTVPTSGGGGGGTTTNTTTTPPPGGGGGGGTTTGTSTTPPPGGTTTSTTPTTTPSDSTPPRVSGARGKATRRGLVVRLTLSEPATITLRLLRRGRRVARKTFHASDGAVKLRIKRRLKRGRYAIRLALVDDAGNKSTKSLRARVK